jgi:hypothetical protein
VIEANGPTSPAPESLSRLRVIFTLLVVIVLGALLAWWLRPMPRPPAQKRSSASPAPAAVPRLKVTSDVEGAFVFVDRKFVGKTPLDTGEVTPGHHQLKVSSEGYEGVSQGVEIAGTGTTKAEVSLKTVRLDANVDVVHKHGMGSCEGKLFADVHGLRYETNSRGDGFTLAFADLDTFTLDYLQKTLRVKKRGGRTWNFTTRAADADPLLAFEREVDHARARLVH